MSLIESPGPSAYSLPSSFGRTGRAVSMARRVNAMKPSGHPGPGSYDVTIPGRATPRITMAPKTKIPEAAIPMETPAPGAYKARENLFGTGGPAVSLKGKFSGMSAPDFPAPGQYEIPSTVGSEAPKFSMSGRLQEPPPKEVTPSPGAYDIDHPFANPKSGFSISSRHDDIINTVTPAPGAYNLKSGLGDAPAFSLKGKAAPEKIVEQAAAVGSYELPSSIGSGPQISLKGKHEQRIDHNLPGPGQYAIDSALNQTVNAAPAYSFRPRTKAPEAAVPLETPAPGAYSARENLFGTGGPAISLKGKFHDPEHNPTPGPLDYSVHDSPTRSAAPAFSMSRRLSESKPKDFTPAPGDYEVSNNISNPKSGATIKSRLPELESSAVSAPAPGAYEIRSTLGEAPAFSLKGKASPEKPADRAPGVGTYEIPSSIGRDGPSITIRGRVDRDDDARVPGPGEYSAEKSLESIVPHAPSYSMRARPKPEPVPNRAPAPGTYHKDLPIGRDAPAYSLSAKIPEKDYSASPGPLHYNPVLPRDSVAYSFLGRPAPAAVEERNAAVGLYEIPSSIGRDGPSISIKGKLPEIEGTPVPGPGSYKLPMLAAGPASTMKARFGSSVYASSTNPLRYIDQGRLGPRTVPIPLPFKPDRR